MGLGYICDFSVVVDAKERRLLMCFFYVFIIIRWVNMGFWRFIGFCGLEFEIYFFLFVFLEFVLLIYKLDVDWIF